MNLSTLIIGAVVAVLVILAIRYTHKHGIVCDECGGVCDGHCGVNIPFDKIRKELDEEKNLASGKR